jgi:hypothetical protein
MPLIHVVVVLIVVGVLLWLINRFIPMAGSIKTILNAVVVIAVVLWLLNVFGVLGSLPNIRAGEVMVQYQVAFKNTTQPSAGYPGRPGG